MQADRVYDNNEQGRLCRNFNFFTPGTGTVVLGCDHIGYIVGMHDFLEMSFPSLEQANFKSI